MHHFAVATLRQANMRLFVSATVSALDRTWEIEVPHNLVHSLRPTLLTESGLALRTMINVMLSGLVLVPPMITLLDLQQQAVREMQAEAAGLVVTRDETVGCDPAKLKIQWQS